MTTYLNTKLTIDEPSEIELARISEARIMEKGAALNNRVQSYLSKNAVWGDIVTPTEKILNFVKYRQIDKLMKNYIIRAIVSAVAFTVVYVILDIIFGHVNSFRDYAVQAVIFGVLFGLFSYLDDKGWNSWEKIGDLFKKKDKNQR